MGPECPYKERRLGHRQAERDDLGHRERTAIRKPRGEALEETTSDTFALDAPASRSVIQATLSVGLWCLHLRLSRLQDCCSGPPPRLWDLLQQPRKSDAVGTQHGDCRLNPALSSYDCSQPQICLYFPTPRSMPLEKCVDICENPCSAVFKMIYKDYSFVTFRRWMPM